MSSHPAVIGSPQLVGYAEAIERSPFTSSDGPQAQLVSIDVGDVYHLE